jgi:antitoxin (DNA-binding transcriptional repressor) of toxin-antitoxin stability system
MVTVTLEEVQEKLPQLLENAIPGEDIIVMRNNIAIARIHPTPAIPETTKQPRQPGSAKDKLIYMAEDFDATPDDFAEYM